MNGTDAAGQGDRLKRASMASPRCPRCEGPSIATSERRKLARPMLVCCSHGPVPARAPWTEYEAPGLAVRGPRSLHFITDVGPTP